LRSTLGAINRGWTRRPYKKVVHTASKKEEHTNCLRLLMKVSRSDATLPFVWQMQVPETLMGTAEVVDANTIHNTSKRSGGSNGAQVTHSGFTFCPKRSLTIMIYWWCSPITRRTVPMPMLSHNLLKSTNAGHLYLGATQAQDNILQLPPRIQ